MNQTIQMIEFEKRAVLRYRSQYDDFYEEARVFQSIVQERIDTSTNEEVDVTLQDSLPQQAIRRKRKHSLMNLQMNVSQIMPKNYRLDVFLPIIQ